uniref:Uncharacterized protein n=1 Tax=Cannabis sativa TaxID=3483 RepID=A0A803NIF8_CANSA
MKSKVEILESVQPSTMESQSRFRVLIPSMQPLDICSDFNLRPTSTGHRDAAKPNNTLEVNYNDYLSRWIGTRGIYSNTWTLFVVIMTPEEIIEHMVARKLEGMEAMINRIPGVPAPIKKSLASSFVDSPFVDALTLVEMPKKFVFPSMKMTIEDVLAKAQAQIKWKEDESNTHRAQGEWNTRTILCSGRVSPKGSTFKSRGLERRCARAQSDDVKLDGRTAGGGQGCPRVATDEVLIEAHVRGLQQDIALEAIVEATPSKVVAKYKGKGKAKNPPPAQIYATKAVQCNILGLMWRKLSIVEESSLVSTDEFSAIIWAYISSEAHLPLRTYFMKSIVQIEIAPFQFIPLTYKLFVAWYIFYNIFKFEVPILELILYLYVVKPQPIFPIEEGTYPSTELSNSRFHTNHLIDMFTDTPEEKMMRSLSDNITKFLSKTEGTKGKWKVKARASRTCKPRPPSTSSSFGVQEIPLL